MSAVSMRLTPSSTARRRTRTPSTGSCTIRIAPKPSLRTSSSPPSRKVMSPYAGRPRAGTTLLDTILARPDGGGANDQLRLEEHGLMPVVRGVRSLVDQQLGCAEPELVAWDAHGGERHQRGLREANVVVADDRDVLRDRQAPRQSRPLGADGA